jgi:hypothetical protein
MKRSKLLVILLLIGLFSLMALAMAPETLTGVVSDDMCGAKHTMGANPTDCTRACVKGGSNYALVVGDKVYTLDAGKDASEVLDKYAGQKVTVTGEVDKNTLKVQSVTAAK